ncbi:lamin tail domain-containing protein [Patescibacteria group bacterium]
MKSSALLKQINIFIFKGIALSLIVCFSWINLSGICYTLAYFNDIEISEDNIYQAGILDFSLNNINFDESIGLTETIFLSSVLTDSNSIDLQYTVEAEKKSGSDDFCNVLELEAELNGIEKYDGNLMLLDTSTSTMTGTWKFDIKMPVSASHIPHGSECNIDFVFKAWQTNVANYNDGGFFDEERINVNLTSSMIVLNEFLPNPGGYAYGFDFGNDSSDMPQGEWVELYNNSDYDFDLAGWYVKDDLVADTNKIMITTSNTTTATTTIVANSWTVVYMNKAVFNNSGDTVKLFDDTDNLIDSYTYNDHDYCELEPTPNDENSDTAVGGSCGDVPVNKSYARIPDGIGDWVDPIPTPGEINKVDDLDVIIEEDVIVEDVMADEEVTEIIIQLAETMNIEDIIATSTVESVAPDEDATSTAQIIIATSTVENAIVENAIIATSTDETIMATSTVESVIATSTAENAIVENAIIATSTVESVIATSTVESVIATSTVESVITDKNANSTVENAIVENAITDGNATSTVESVIAPADEEDVSVIEELTELDITDSAELAEPVDVEFIIEEDSGEVEIVEEPIIGD